jgi:type IV secretory pathway VirB6-like protein
MTTKEKLIANRMSVAFILLISILASLSPTLFLGKDIFLIIPLLLLLLLISWLVYSSLVKKRLIDNAKIREDIKDFIDNFMWDFKPNSKIKVLFGAVGLSGGVLIVLASILVIISPELPSVSFFHFMDTY